MSTKYETLTSVREWKEWKESIDLDKMWVESNFKKCVTNPVNWRQKQVSVVLYERFENALICVIFTSLSARFLKFQTFLFFAKPESRRNFWILFWKIVYPKGFFGERKKISNFCNCPRILDNYWQRLLKLKRFYIYLVKFFSWIERVTNTLFDWNFAKRLYKVVLLLYFCTRWCLYVLAGKCQGKPFWVFCQKSCQRKRCANCFKFSRQSWSIQGTFFSVHLFIDLIEL